MNDASIDFLRNTTVTATVCLLLYPVIRFQAVRSFIRGSSLSFKILASILITSMLVGQAVDDVNLSFPFAPWRMYTSANPIALVHYGIQKKTPDGNWLPISGLDKSVPFRKGYYYRRLSFLNTEMQTAIKKGDKTRADSLKTALSEAIVQIAKRQINQTQEFTAVRFVVKKIDPKSHTSEVTSLIESPIGNP